MDFEEVFIYEHKVQFYETDKMGISHHSNYIRWMEEARMAFFASCGADYGQLEEKGIESPVVSVECRYKAPSRFGEVLRIAVKTDYFNGVRLRFSYSFLDAQDKLIAAGMTEHCFVNSAGTVLNMKKACPEFWRSMAANTF